MARADGRVQPGQRVDTAFSARAWNRAQDAADIVLAAQRGVEAGGWGPSVAPYAVMPIRNTSASTVYRWNVLQIDNVETLPNASSTGGTRQFEQTPVLRGRLPTGLSNSFAVALEPIRAGQYGQCAVAGVVQVKCDISSTGDDYVRTQFNSTRLKTGGYGEGLILWKEAGTGGDKWALVRLATPAGAVMIRFSGAWALGATKSVTILDTSDTLNVVNRFVSISAACDERYGAAIKYGDAWYLTAAQFE